jgi:hypothetical protein
MKTDTRTLDTDEGMLDELEGLLGADMLDRMFKLWDRRKWTRAEEERKELHRRVMRFMANQ